MRKNFYQLPALLCCFTLLMSCGAGSTKSSVSNEEPASGIKSSQPSKKVSQASTDSSHQQLVGNDRDDHGCIASAGYQWSELLKDCIRPFEKGTRLKSTDPNATSAAYLVFNADSSQVELFLPKEKKHPILTRKGTANEEMIWNGENEAQWSVRCIKGNWEVSLNDKVYYVKD